MKFTHDLDLEIKRMFHNTNIKHNEYPLYCCHFESNLANTVTCK